MSKKINIKLQEMIDAMENHNEYIRHYIDLENGEIIFTADEYFIEDIENENDILIAENPEQYCFIEIIDSDEAFKIMESFVHNIDDKTIQDVLYKSIYRPKPFRSFKETLANYPDLKEKYRSYHQEQMSMYVEEWLDEKNIFAALI